MCHDKITSSFLQTLHFFSFAICRRSLLFPFFPPSFSTFFLLFLLCSYSLLSFFLSKLNRRSLNTRESRDVGWMKSTSAGSSSLMEYIGRAFFFSSFTLLSLAASLVKLVRKKITFLRVIATAHDPIVTLLSPYAQFLI